MYRVLHIGNEVAGHHVPVSDHDGLGSWVAVYTHAWDASSADLAYKLRIHPHSSLSHRLPSSLINARAGTCVSTTQE